MSRCRIPIWLRRFLRHRVNSLASSPPPHPHRNTPGVIPRRWRNLPTASTCSSRILRWMRLPCLTCHNPLPPRTSRSRRRRSVSSPPTGTPARWPFTATIFSSPPPKEKARAPNKDMGKTSDETKHRRSSLHPHAAQGIDRAPEHSVNARKTSAAHASRRARQPLAQRSRNDHASPAARIPSST